MIIKVTYLLNERIEDFTILDSFLFGFDDFVDDGTNHPINHYFDSNDINGAKEFITRLFASIHPTGNDLTILKEVIKWYDILMALLDGYEKTGIFNGTTLKGTGKYEKDYISISLEE